MMFKRIIFSLISIAVLAAGAWRSVGRTEPLELSAWRAQIRLAFDSVPDSLGDKHAWVMISEVPIPTSQARMLDLNAQISRRYQLLRESPIIQATVFVAHSNDARAMAGHHPPNCYPSSGWIRLSGLDQEFFSELPDGRPLRMHRYAFSRGDGLPGVQVVNGFILPGGRVVSRLSEASGVMQNASESRLGLVQFQILFHGSIDPERVMMLSSDLVGSFVSKLIEPMSREDWFEDQAMSSESGT